MSFCRHQLLRASAQHHFLSLLTNKRVLLRTLSSETPITLPPPLSHAYSTTSRYNSHEADVRPPKKPPSLAETFPPKIDTHDLEDEGSAMQDDRDVPKPLRTNRSLNDPILSYTTLRKKSQQDMLDVPVMCFVAAVSEVFRTNRLDVVPMLVEDALHIVSRHPKHGGRLITELLRRLTRGRILTKVQVLRLLEALRENDQLRFVHRAYRTTITRRIMAYQLNYDIDGEIFSILGPWLAEVIPQVNTPEPESIPDTHAWERSSMGPLVTSVAWPLYQVVLSLVMMGKTKEASKIVAKLAHRQAIRTEAINATDLSSKDYVYVVLSVLVRTCLLYGWFIRATTLLVPTVTARDDLSPPMIHLIEDWISAALADARDEDLDQIASILILLFKRTDAYTVPPQLLQGFYTSAVASNRLELVQTIYRHSHDSHPPPLDDKLIWFMQRLQTESRNVHLARTLTSQVVEQNIPISPSGRAAFIIAAATMGFTSQARALYERYSTGRDKLYVVGRRTVMLRLVSAFVKAEHYARRVASRRAGDAEEADVFRVNVPDEAVGWKDEEVHTTPQTQLDDRVEDDPASDAPQPPASPPPHGDARSDLAPPFDRPAPAEEEVRGSMGYAGLTRSELLERADDLRRFAEHVFDAFRRGKEPLASAEHFELNALARGAVMLGQDSLAFEAFDIVKKRGTKLDMFDVNVALSVVSRTNPAAGAARIERMIESGYEPDAVTFGTVIHWAIIHGDGPLVGELLRKARERGLKDLSFKTMGSLLHATVSPMFESIATPSSQLENARDIVDTMLDAGIVPTANMGRDCIVAALRAEEPVMAFRFWRQLVKGKVEWVDAAQGRLRGRIARKVRAHCERGWLDEERGRAILSELGYDPVYALYVRRRRGAVGG